MPHLMIDYQRMLNQTWTWALCDTLRDVAASIDAFPLAGVKVRGAG